MMFEIDGRRSGKSYQAYADTIDAIGALTKNLPNVVARYEVVMSQSTLNNLKVHLPTIKPPYLVHGIPVVIDDNIGGVIEIRERKVEL